MLCPPLDLINGGLKAVPEEGKWDETDKPLQIIFEEFEEIVTKGSGNELVYQFVDKYMDTQTRYFDSKTGQIVEGKSLVSDVEVVENEVIKGSVVCVSREYCMNGQMEVDQEVGKVFYEKFMSALVYSEVNKEYFNNLLNGNVSPEALKTYLDANDGMVPAGLKMITGVEFYASMNKVLDKPVNLSALKTMTFGSREWQNDENSIQEYLKEYSNDGLINLYANTGYAWVYFGWFVDEKDYLVIVSGSKDPYDYSTVIGSGNGDYVPEHDNKAATIQALSLITFMEKFYKEFKHGKESIEPFSNATGSMGAYMEDLQRLLGGKYLLKSVN